MVEAGGRDSQIQARRTNSMAKAALVAGIIEFVLPPAAIVAIVLGHLAMHQIRRTGQEGLGIAKVGLILGYFGVLLGVLAPLLIGGITTGVPAPNR